MLHRRGLQGFNLVQSPARLFQNLQFSGIKLIFPRYLSPKRLPAGI